MHLTSVARVALVSSALPFCVRGQSTPGAPAASAAPVLVSVEWLGQHREDRGVVVIHAARQKADYDSSHVPGSRWLDWSAYTVSTPGGLSTQLPPLEQAEAALEGIGISDDSRVVITGGPITVAGRLFYTLEYFGLAGRVSLLDGGTTAWRAAGKPTDRESPAAVASGSLTLRPTAGRLALVDWVSSSSTAAGVAILDARLPEFYSGASAGGQPRAGHIPGARNIPFTSTAAGTAQFKGMQELQAMFDAAGVKQGDKVVAYCHIGMQATALYIAARILGYDAAVYDGSWEEWSRRAELPIIGAPIKP